MFNLKARAHIKCKTKDIGSQILDSIFKGKVFKPPSKIYIGLLITRGVIIAEPDPMFGYSRVRAKLKDWDRNLNGKLTNKIAFSFNMATKSWGTATHLGIFDAKTKGNLIMCDSLVKSRNIDREGTAAFLPGDISVGMKFFL